MSRPILPFGLERVPRPVMWIAFILILVLLVPMATFFVNRDLLGPPDMAVVPTEEIGGVLDPGPEYSATHLFDLPFGDAVTGFEVSGVDNLSGTPLDIEVISRDEQDRIWVVDHPATTVPRARVRVFDVDGGLISDFTTPPGSTLFTPGLSDDMWLDLTGTDAGTEIIQRYGMDGTLLGEYPLPDGFLARFIRFDPDGVLYVYQEQWYLNPDDGSNEYSGVLIPVAASGTYEPFEFFQPIDGAFFAGDDLYVIASTYVPEEGGSEAYRVSAVSREGDIVGRYEFPEGYKPYAADALGRVWAEKPAEQLVAARGRSIIGDVGRESADILVMDRNGDTSRLSLQRPAFISTWSPSVWIDSTGGTAVSMDAGGIGVWRVGASVGERTVIDATEYTDPDLMLLASEVPLNGDPYQARDALERDLMHLIYDGLVVMDDTLDPVPRIAREVPSISNDGISPDGLTITYEVRSDITWHDGEPLTALDVVATWKYLSRTRPMPMSEPFPGFEFISDVTAEGDELQVHLTEPFGAGPETFFPYVLPAHVLDSIGDSVNSVVWANPIGSGPYRLVRWEEDGLWQLEAHADTAQGAPIIQRIDVEFSPSTTALGSFQTSRVPTIWLWPDAVDIAALERDAIGSVAWIDTGRWEGILFNDEDALSDPSARRSLVETFPRAQLTGSVLSNDIESQSVDLYPRVSNAHASEGARRSQETSETVIEDLDAAGWAPDSEGFLTKGGTRFDVDLHVGRRGDTDEVSFEYVDAVVGSWAELGIVAVRDMSQEQLYDQYWSGGFLALNRFSAAHGVYPGTPDAGWGGIFDPYCEPDAWRTRGIGVGASRNDGGIGDLYALARAEYDPETRDAISREITELVVEQDRAVFVEYEQRPVALIGAVRGFAPGPYPAGDLWAISRWEIME